MLTFQANQVQPTAVDNKLAARQEVDQGRDPLDALHDAEALQKVLLFVQRILRDPSTSYHLRDRIREDLACADMLHALDQANQLVQINQERWDLVVRESRKVGP